ncbi:MAG: sodium:proton antiporter [Gammaproteobacteria bacterium]|nr:sodium:proton antiporter [Gammaproteobacteria bacterium]|tara:strand:- start:4379 stop:5347 length:969 start_codon:yes stop_codon:yes gene_type:complete
MSAELLPDMTLTLLLLIMAWGALYAPQRSDAMALFIAFGVVVALIWARLDAPDLALAEAAIGAGLTGVLLMHAARALPDELHRSNRTATYWGALAFAVVASLMFLAHLLTDDSLLNAGLLDTDSDVTPSLRVLADANVADSGVSHPVTAVLLNFRAWDTLLELLVLLFALSGLRQLFPRESAPDDHATSRWPESLALMSAWARVLAPLLVVTGGYLLWRGSSAPGGAFQAGSLLAAAAVMLRLTGLLPALRWSSVWLRLSVVAGALFFLSVAAATAIWGDGWLTYPAAASGLLIVSIEIFATLSIAITLSLLVIGEWEDLRS